MHRREISANSVQQLWAPVECRHAEGTVIVAEWEESSWYSELCKEMENSINVPVSELVAKNIKALNHEEHEGHKGKEKVFFVLFVSFVVPFFSGAFATPSFEVVAKM